MAYHYTIRPDMAWVNLQQSLILLIPTVDRVSNISEGTTFLIARKVEGIQKVLCGMNLCGMNLAKR
ncbi:hypothetical protein GcC1_167010 [Golovinomyces cichoracearum]|uniref:Uncharacterized protein n=1 Tax=Golovinomyces cichoracearum TaxID=62708 RepID=A0A420HS39_9PEZI|nr:hypothetical protein GcC1_167010 [Golovinomyces cichoracearum]